MLDIVVAGEVAGDISAIVPIRFARASRFAANLRTPDIDDHGYVPSGTADNLKPARGPTLGMTRGGAEIRIRVVRDALGPDHELFVTQRIVGVGDVDALTIVWPPKGVSLTAVDKEFRVDHIYLRSDFPVAGSPAPKLTAEEEALAQAEAENERLLVSRLKYYALEPQLALEDLAIEVIRARKQQFPNGDQPDGLSSDPTKAVEDFLFDPRRDASPTPAEAESIRLARALFTAKKEVLDDVWDGLHFPRLDSRSGQRDRAEPAERQAIIDSLTPLRERVDVMRSVVTRRRAAAARPTTQFIVEVRLGASDGPVLAELGVVVLPPLVVEVQPFFVSLGAGRALGGNGPDRTHLDYVDGVGQLDYEALVTLVSRVNGILAPAGVHLFVRRSEPRAFRVADEVDRPDPKRPVEPLKPNQAPDVYVRGFDAIFFQGALAAAELKIEARYDPWLNIIMGSQAGFMTEKRISIYFVRAFIVDMTQLDIMAGKNVERVAMGLGAEWQTQGPGVLKVQALPSVRKGHSRGKKPKKVQYEFALGADRVGMAVNLSTIKFLTPGARTEADPMPASWSVVRAIARTVAHELAHLCNVAHYRGGDDKDAFHDLWAVRNVMHTDEFLGEGFPPSGYGRQIAGAQLTVKSHPLPPGDFREVYERGTQQLTKVRHAISSNRYFGPGGSLI